MTPVGVGAEEEREKKEEKKKGGKESAGGNFKEWQEGQKTD